MFHTSSSTDYTQDQFLQNEKRNTQDTKQSGSTKPTSISVKIILDDLRAAIILP